MSINIESNSKNGLVLEGGAMRGMFTSGVLDVFLEENIIVDGVVGTSAGAVFGCNYKSKQHRRAIRYNVNYGRDWRYGSFRNLLLTGDYFSKDFAYYTVPIELDPFDSDTYSKNPMDFYICVTDIVSGRPEYFLSKEGSLLDIKWMRASASMPMFSNIVEIDGHKYLDGGISDSIPLKFMQGKGYNKNIVILTQPLNYKKKRNKALGIIKLKYKKYPNMVRAMARRHSDYNNTIEYIKESAKSGDTLIIAPPSSLKISRIEKDPKELIRVYRVGRKVAKRMLPQIRDFLGSLDS